MILPKYPGSQPSKKAIWLAFGGVAIWAILVFTGMRLPYIYTEFSFRMRTFVLFPILLSPFLYASFVHRMPNQPIGFIYVVNQYTTRKERVKACIMSLIGLFGLPAGLAWTSVAFPAWAANVFATNDYERSYQVVDVTVRSGAVWSTLFDIDLIDTSSREKVSLLLDRARWEQHHWETGELLCAKGRTSMFGTVIDSTNTGCNAPKKRVKKGSG